MAFKVIPGLRTEEYSVRFSYKGYIISLAWDQSQTAIWEEEETITSPIVHTINGASAETIREAILWIDQA